MTEAEAPALELTRAERGVRIVLAIAVIVGPLVARVGCEAHGELDQAEAARAAGDEDEEVVHLGRALRWRLPGSSHDEAAIARLLELGEAARVRQDPRGALAAYREIRSALLGARALDVPHADVLADVDARIAALMAEGGDAQAQRLAELRREPERSRVGLVAAAAAFVAWAWATARLLLAGLDGRGRLVPGSGTRMALVALGLLVAWLVLWRYA